MYRIGAQFEHVSPAQQSTLDRFLFKEMLAEARQKRHLIGLVIRADGGFERRRSHRVSMRRDAKRLAYAHVQPTGWEEVTPQQLTAAEQAKLLAELEEQREKSAKSDKEEFRFLIDDISSTGCAFFCDHSHPPRKGTVLTLRIIGDGLDIILQARVMYVATYIPPRKTTGSGFPSV